MKLTYSHARKNRLEELIVRSERGEDGGVFTRKINQDGEGVFGDWLDSSFQINFNQQ